MACGSRMNLTKLSGAPAGRAQIIRGCTGGIDAMSKTPALSVFGELGPIEKGFQGLRRSRVITSP